MSDQRRFLLNDRLVELPPHEHGLTLAWLRENQGLTGTKEGCGEGECGACTVLLGDLVNGAVAYRAVVSCLLPVDELPGRHLVTIEGLNPDKGLNPIQQHLVDAGAPQCGFCFPGIVTSLTGFCQNSDDLSTADGIAAIDGNICRCTGYTSIHRAIAALSGEFGPKLDPAKPRIEQLVAWGILPAHFATAAERLAALARPDTDAPQTDPAPTLIGGGTDLMVQQPDLSAANGLSFLTRRPELGVIERELDHLTIGGGVTIEALQHSAELRRLVPDAPAMIARFASTVIRNRATVAGNLVNASPIGDITMLMMALDGELVLARDGHRRTLPLGAFYLGYKQLALEAGELVEAVRIPLSVQDDQVSFEKISQRRFLDIASVTSAARLRLDGGVVRHVTLALGGVAPVPLLARGTMAFLTGRSLDAATVLEAARVLDGEIAPIDDVRGSAAYKRELARRILFAHVLKIAPDQVRYEELA